MACSVAVCVLRVGPMRDGFFNSSEPRQQSSTTGERSPRDLFCPPDTWRAIGCTTSLDQATIRTDSGFGIREVHISPDFSIERRQHTIPTSVVLVKGHGMLSLRPTTEVGGFRSLRVIGRTVIYPHQKSQCDKRSKRHGTAGPCYLSDFR